MSFTIETTEAYDQTNFNVLGFVMTNNVEAVSLFRDVIGGIQGIFGEKNKAFQEAADRLLRRGLEEFKQTIVQKYPSTEKVVALRTDITEMGGERPVLFLHISATCLASKKQQPQKGGKTASKKSRKTRNNRSK
jgi:uncharacterized protein YbjQ (UPF0145 family)